MAQLYTKIKLYLNRDFEIDTDVMLQNDGQGDYIKEWHVAETKPTEAQLDALEADATKLESNEDVIQTRINLYGSTAEQLEYIVENGVDAFIAKQQQIKTDNPKG